MQLPQMLLSLYRPPCWADMVVAVCKRGLEQLPQQQTQFAFCSTSSLMASVPSWAAMLGRKTGPCSRDMSGWRSYGICKQSPTHQTPGYSHTLSTAQATLPCWCEIIQAQPVALMYSHLTVSKMSTLALMSSKFTPHPVTSDAASSIALLPQHACWLCTANNSVMIICSGLAGGALACSTLAALKQPIILLLKLQPTVLHDANPYWWIRVAITPFVLLNMTLSGILQVGRIPP